MNTRQPPLPPSLYFDFLRDTYATSQATAIRRLAEQSPRVASLGRVLTEISEEPQRLTRRQFVSASPVEPQPRGDETFTELFAGDVGDHVDPHLVADDLALLEDQVRTVVDHVDQCIAHADARPRADLATLEDANDALDVIGGLFSTYFLLLTGESYATLVPAPQYHWQAIFDEPWRIYRPARTAAAASQPGR